MLKINICSLSEIRLTFTATWAEVLPVGASNESLRKHKTVNFKLLHFLTFSFKCVL